MTEFVMQPKAVFNMKYIIVNAYIYFLIDPKPIT